MSELSIFRTKANFWTLSIAWIALIWLTGTAVRVLATQGDLGFDEVWSIRIGMISPTVSDVFINAKHDNNHWLNTLWLRAFDPFTSSFFLRLHVLIMGSITILLMALFASRAGRADAIIAAVFAATSYPFIHYSSEARGYAGALCFGVLSAWLADRYTCRTTVVNAALFAAAAVIGCLWHLTYLPVFCGIAIWTFWRLIRPDWRKGALRWLALVGPPATLYVLLCFTSVKDMVIGGGPQPGRWEATRDTLAIAVGVIAAGPYQSAAAIIVASLIVGALFYLYKHKSDLWLLYAGVLAAAPLIALAWGARSSWQPRYFLTGFPFLFMLNSHLFAAAWRQNRIARLLAVSTVLAFVGLNVPHIRRHLRYGCGTYSNAVSDLASWNQGKNTVISSDHDFRNFNVLGYHAEKRQLPVVFIPSTDAEHAEWFLIHHVDLRHPFPPSIINGRSEFALEKTYPYAGLSGWTWGLYRRVYVAPAWQPLQMGPPQ